MAKAEIVIQCAENPELVKQGYISQVDNNLTRGDQLTVGEWVNNIELVTVDLKVSRIYRKYTLHPILCSTETVFNNLIQEYEEVGFIFR